MTSPTQWAPIAIFAYRRIETLRATLDSLKCCDGFTESAVTIFVDGPKDSKDQADVAAVRAFVDSIDLPNVGVVHAEENRGLRRSIHAGVSSILDLHDRIIVVEDDLILAPSALTYFNAALDKYAQEERVWSVSGYVYDVPGLATRQTAFFLPFAQSWGWATWRRAWSQFPLDLPIEDDHLRSPSFRRAFSMNGTSDFAEMLRLAKQGDIDSWYVRWYYRIFLASAVSLFPPRTLVANRGLSAGGTHAGRFNPYDFLVPAKRPTAHSPALPDRVDVDYEAVDLVPRSWEASVIRWIHKLGALRRRLRRPGR